MKIQKAIQNVFVQLSDSLQQLSDDEYTQQCPTLFKATIGQHVRQFVREHVRLPGDACDDLPRIVPDGDLFRCWLLAKVFREAFGPWVVHLYRIKTE